ncbi:hypothetical protein [Eshraghiella crossota]|uniref:hypothetical protein n=1 Tax=Eshraghiella crossota TaxID=45851 RepID=UPI003F807FAF
MGFTKIEHSDTNSRFFLDRKDILEDIEKIVCEYNATNRFYKLFTFYGMGGIGKSRLITEVYNRYQGTDCSVYNISLEILNHETVPAILLFIRKNFQYTPHFDYALFKYWDFILYKSVDREDLMSISKKLLLRLGKKFDAIVGRGYIDTEPLILNLITLFEERSITDEERKKVSNLLQDKIEELYIYLAENLAKDIENELNGQKFMFLFDAYDLGRSSYKFDWLKYFINNFENGLFFVTSRDPLGWFEHDSVDNSKVRSYSLENIPPEEVQKFLCNKYQQDQIDCIIKNTGCIPLYLDLALRMVNSNFSLIDEGVVFKTKEELVRKFLSHFNADSQAIIEYLSIVKFFDISIYERAVKFNNLSSLKYDFTNFKKSTIVRYVENFDQLYKIHDVLAKNIAYFVNEEACKNIVCDYLNTVYARVLSNEYLTSETKYTLIVNVYRLVESEKLIISELQSEKLIDMFFYLLDHGYTRDFYNYIISIDDKEKSNLFYIYEYIIGKIIRGSNIIDGLMRLQKIPLNVCRFGKHKKSLVCDINYIISISGNYSKAEKQISKFANELKETEKCESYYIKGKIYNSDMQMLRGKFKSAVMQFELLANDVDDKKFAYEIQKAIGHCYRFNFLFEEALKHYKNNGNSTYNMSYYYTVCCETYCYFAPKKVYGIYNKALKENQKYNNHNNLGKIYYAMAIANIVCHNVKNAKHYIKKSYDEFTNTNYHSGKLFTMMAEVYLEYYETRDISIKTIKNIDTEITKLDGIYKYLLLPIYVIKKDQKMIQSIKSNYEWLDYGRTLKNITNFLRLL